MNVIGFVLTNLDSLVTAFVALVGIISLYKRNEKQMLGAILFRLVTDAEREFGNGMGVFQKSAVIEWLYDKMPLALKFIMTRAELEEMVDSAVVRAKELWAEKPRLGEYAAGEMQTE